MLRHEKRANRGGEMDSISTLLKLIDTRVPRNREELSWRIALFNKHQTNLIRREFQTEHKSWEELADDLQWKNAAELKAHCHWKFWKGIPKFRPGHQKHLCFTCRDIWSIKIGRIGCQHFGSTADYFDRPSFDAYATVSDWPLEINGTSALSQWAPANLFGCKDHEKVDCLEDEIGGGLIKAWRKKESWEDENFRAAAVLLFTWLWSHFRGWDFYQRQRPQVESMVLAKASYLNAQEVNKEAKVKLLGLFWCSFLVQIISCTILALNHRVSSTFQDWPEPMMTPDIICMPNFHITSKKMNEFRKQKT